MTLFCIIILNLRIYRLKEDSMNKTPTYQALETLNPVYFPQQPIRHVPFRYKRPFLFQLLSLFITEL